MKTILNCAISVDGYLDDANHERLLLSNIEDFDRVDALRASCDAILIGANTLRKDNPRLLIRSKERQLMRTKRGLPPQPIKVTITYSGKIDPSSAFFSQGETKKIIFTPSEHVLSLQKKLEGKAIVVPISDTKDPFQTVLTHLRTEGVHRLLVEGGQSIITQVLQANLVDELFIAIAPFFVGQANAPRFVGEGAFSWDKTKRMQLTNVQKLGDVAVLHYLLNNDRYWLEQTIKLAQHCPPVTDAFAVGAIIVDRDGKLLAEGFSRETDPKIHAEESALAKIRDKQMKKLIGATIYSSLEPCNKRLSRPRGCSQLIINAGIKRVVFAACEPPIFVPGNGADKLRAAGITVITYPDYEENVIAAQTPIIQKKWRCIIIIS